MGLIGLVNTLFRLYSWIILARVLLSWVRVDPWHPAVVWLHRLTEPVLKPFRRLLPTVGGIDFSPILVFFVLDIVRQIVISLLWQLGRW